MAITKELLTPTLEMMLPAGWSSETERHRRALFGHMYGPAGREFHRGIRDGSLDITRLSSFKDRINTYFFDTIRERYAIPKHIRAEDFYTDLQGIGLGVVRKIIEEAFPQLGKKLGQFKNEVKVKPPSPTTLFKILALPDGLVDRRLVSETTRQLIIGDTAGSLYVKSKHADLNQMLSDWNDIFNEKLYEGPYGAGEAYQRYAYHDSETNEVKIFSAKGNPKPPSKGENLATHNFTARRVRDYGLVYVDITEVGVVEATSKVLIAAANNGGEIQPEKDASIGIKMTFVDLGDNLRRRKDKDNNIPHLTALKSKVMKQVLKHVDIADMSIPPDSQIGNSKSNAIEIYGLNLPNVPIRLEFWNTRDYLNRKYEVGVKAPIEGIPEPVYNGRSERLDNLRAYYSLIPYLFPREFFGDTQDGLIMTMNRVAMQLKEECTSQVNHFNQEEIPVLLSKKA